ncbi:hypothetical protein SAMD00023353_1401440 [Rosellinia necatrix]|uniref:Uncharacterized protein n=1 Tax=Rosellinia necatrix TaxID=77044 RepID=A0A1W2TD01_ROSNE|nr:hypothetical protein SAMD00023353_1401440 [Rosellinia necatrix]
MAAAVVVEAIGLISGFLGIIQFGIDNIPEVESVGSTVRVRVGLDFNGRLSNTGGDLPDIRLFNEAGEFIGITADPGTVKSGMAGDITVEHKSNLGQQATYTLFSANNDAICIAYASITWPNGEEYGWVGDWGRQCGGSWYYSNVYISASSYTPDCLWIDGNNNQPQTGFQIHWPEFANDNPIPDSLEGQHTKIDHLCNSGPPFQMHTYPDKDPRSIMYWAPRSGRSLSDKRVLETATSYGPPKHAVSARFESEQDYNEANQTTTPQLIGMSMVISDSEKHSAEDLCNSATSYGPDFMNIKSEIFCRMSDKTIWPICNAANIIDNCFNTGLSQLVLNGIATRDEPYHNVIDWTSAN